jgi:hypothetical protein
MRTQGYATHTHTYRTIPHKRAPCHVHVDVELPKGSGSGLVIADFWRRQLGDSTGTLRGFKPIVFQILLIVSAHVNNFCWNLVMDFLPLLEIGYSWDNFWMIFVLVHIHCEHKIET